MAILTEVNKLIFIQEFEEANTLLESLMVQYPDDFEVHFRHIEISMRLGTIKKHLQKSESQIKDQTSLCKQIYVLMLKIRSFEMSKNQASLVEMTNILNPSTRNFVALSNPLFREGWGSHTQETPKQTSFHVKRDSIDTPDDFVLLSQEDEALKDSPEKILDQIIELSKFNTEHYAVWFVLGNAYDLNGNLAQAIECWKLSAQLQPQSIACISTLAELQQAGAIPQQETDYTEKFEQLDKYLVHGSYETHTELYSEFIQRKKYSQALSALRTLADWIQRQRGEVPKEIEAYCLLGALKAYSLSGNKAAAEACKLELDDMLERIVTESDSTTQLLLIAKMCSEFGLESKSSFIYCAIISHPEARIETITQAAGVLLSQRVSRDLLKALKTAYVNHHGHEEIKYCILLCNLVMNEIPIEPYFKKKEMIRDKFSARDYSEVLPLLEESLQEHNEDPETHQTLAEIYHRMNMIDKAKEHFEKMFELDPLNKDTQIRYLVHLTRMREFTKVINITNNIFAVEKNYTYQNGDLFWIVATAHFALKEIEKAQVFIEKSLLIEPWNSLYIVTAIRIQMHQIHEGIHIEDSLIDFLENMQSESPFQIHQHAIGEWIEKTTEVLQFGYSGLSYLMAKFLMITNPQNQAYADLFVLAASSSNSHAATRDLVYLKDHALSSTTKLSFTRIAIYIAQIHAKSGQWQLVQEWLYMANTSAQPMHAWENLKFLELEALSLIHTGTHLDKAQKLLDAALDAADIQKVDSTSLEILMSYVLIAKGELKPGVDRLRQSISKAQTIESMYFAIKGLERAGQLTGTETLDHFLSKRPVTPLEQKLIEEVFCILGVKSAHPTLYLAS